MLNQLIIDLLSEKSGVNVKTPEGAGILRNDIESKTGEALSLNTIKRLVGLLPYTSIPRQSTLNILAEYLGFSSWQLLTDFIKGTTSGFNTGKTFIELKELPVDFKLKLTWEPDREIIIRHLGDGRFEIEKSKNSKLQETDILTLSQIAPGFPLIAENVVRQGKSLGNYQAAPKTGIKTICFL